MCTRRSGPWRCLWPSWRVWRPPRQPTWNLRQRRGWKPPTSVGRSVYLSLHMTTSARRFPCLSIVFSVSSVSSVLKKPREYALHGNDARCWEVASDTEHTETQRTQRHQVLNKMAHRIRFAPPTCAQLMRVVHDKKRTTASAATPTFST